MLNRSALFSTVVVLAGLVFLPACAKKQTAEDPKDLIAKGWNEYTLSEFGRAIAKFEAAVNSPQPEEKWMALYGLATTWNLRRPGEDLEKATEIYRQIIREAPDHDLAAWSLLALARMKHLVPVGQDPDLREVCKAYQEVIDRFPNHLAAKEAFIYQCSVLVSSLDHNDAKQALSVLGEYTKNPTNTFIGPAYSLMAVAYTTLGNQEQRLQAEILSLNNTEVDPTNPFTEFSWPYWNIATIAEFDVGDFDTARVYYNKLIDEYPTDVRVYGAKQALKRMDQLEAKIRAEQ